MYPDGGGGWMMLPGPMMNQMMMDPMSGKLIQIMYVYVCICIYIHIYTSI